MGEAIFKKCTQLLCVPVYDLHHLEIPIKRMFSLYQHSSVAHARQQIFGWRRRCAVVVPRACMANFPCQRKINIPVFSTTTNIPAVSIKLDPFCLNQSGMRVVWEWGDFEKVYLCSVFLIMHCERYGNHLFHLSSGLFMLLLIDLHPCHVLWRL